MIPYVIICRSCSAKLKVSVPGLIGKTIDCPKCTTELTLTPPAGYENPLTNSADAKDSTTNSFDDLDDLLGQVRDSPPAPQLPVNKNRAVKRVKEVQESAANTVANEVPEPRQKRQASKRQQPQSATVDPVTLDSPMLPDGSWDSDALKKRKRLIQFGSLGVLGILLAAIGVSFIAGRGTTDTKPPLLKESPTAQRTDESSTGNSPEIVNAETIPDADQNSVDGTATSEPASVTDLDGGEATAVRGAADFAAPVISDSGFNTPTPKKVSPPLPSEPPSEPAAIANAKQLDAPAQTDNTADTTSAETNISDSFVKDTPKESPLVPSRKSLADFARALEEAGTVLSEIKDQALLDRDSALIGLPKYFVEPRDEDSVDVPKQLAVSVSGVQFTDLPMLDVLFELESLSGLPVSIDWDADAVRATDFSQKISLKTQDENFESLFATVADKVNLTVIANNQGVILTEGQPSEVTDHTWKLVPPLSDASVDELKGFIVRTWPLEITGGEPDATAARKELEKTVAVTPEQVTLSCDADRYARLDALITGMTSAAKPESASLTMSASSVTPTVFRIDSILERPLDLAKDNPFRRPYRIGSLLRQIRQQAGLNIFVDWPSFQTYGWSPNSSIPGNFSEANCRDALVQFARSLKASWIVIDEKTVLLTSFETANGHFETEVYPVKFLLQKNLTSGELKRVLEDTLRHQLQMPGVSVVYFGEYDCLISHAPQTVHRQLYSILNRLWQDLK